MNMNDVLDSIITTEDDYTGKHSIVSRDISLEGTNTINMDCGVSYSIPYGDKFLRISISEWGFIELVDSPVDDE